MTDSSVVTIAPGFGYAEVTAPHIGPGLQVPRTTMLEPGMSFTVSVDESGKVNYHFGTEPVVVMTDSSAAEAREAAKARHPSAAGAPVRTKDDVSRIMRELAERRREAKADNAE